MKRQSSLKYFFGMLSTLFGMPPAGASEYETADIYRDMRSMVLQQPAHNSGLLMETGYDGAVMTLVAISDDTVSIYFSNGGGMLGMGFQDEPRRVAAELLALAAHFRAQAVPAPQQPLPGKSKTRFYFLTGGEVLASPEFVTDDLGNNRLPFSPLFHKAHELMAAVREAQERQQAQPPQP
jgi:hypothetical protein